VLAAQATAASLGCQDVADMIFVQRSTGQMKFWTREVLRFGFTLFGHVDATTGQIRIWTGAALGDVIHEAVHKTTGITSDSPLQFRERVMQCGGTLR